MYIKFHCSSEKTFKTENQQLRAFVYTDYSIEPHNHDFYEMNIILSGSGIHQLGNSHFRVKAGDVFIIPPTTVHAYYDTNSLDVYHILMKKNFILDNRAEAANVPGFLQLVEIEPFLRQHFSSEMFLHLSVSQMVQLQSELGFIEDGCSLDIEELQPLKKHTVWKTLYWLSALLFKQMYSKDKKSTCKYDIEIIKILEYIHKNYDSKITIDLLCKKSFLSRSTFIRSFTAMCGCTPMEYVNKYRSGKALEMMAAGNLSKTVIAHRCGFYDLSHMEKTIKQLF